MQGIDARRVKTVANARRNSERVDAAIQNIELRLGVAVNQLPTPPTSVVPMP